MTRGIDPDDVHARRFGLAGLRLDFPGYRIWCEATGDHARLVAVSQLLGVSPHTVVTDDAAELRDALSHSACPAMTVRATTPAALRAAIEQAIDPDGWP